MSHFLGLTSIALIQFPEDCNVCQDKTDQFGFFFPQPKLDFTETEGAVPLCSPAPGSVPPPPVWGFPPGSTTPPWWVCTRCPLCTDWAQFHPAPKGKEKRSHLQIPHVGFWGKCTQRIGVFNCDTQGHQSFNLVSFVRMLLSSSLSIIELCETLLDIIQIVLPTEFPYWARLSAFSPTTPHWFYYENLKLKQYLQWLNLGNAEIWDRIINYRWEICFIRSEKLQYCPRRFHFFLHTSEMESHPVTAITISFHQNLGWGWLGAFGDSDSELNLRKFSLGLQF